MSGAAFLVSDINTTKAASNPDSFPGGFANAAGTIFFRAGNGADGVERWKTDGVETRLVKDMSYGNSGPNPSDHVSSLTAVNGSVFFVAYGSPGNKELYKSDGTPAGTVLVKDIYPGATSSSPSNPAAAHAAATGRRGARLRGLGRRHGSGALEGLGAGLVGGADPRHQPRPLSVANPDRCQLLCALGRSGVLRGR